MSRVALGAAWLDETEGPEWVERIDLDELSMGDSRACICGQVFAKAAGERGAGYWVVFDRLNKAYVEGNATNPEMWMANHGFYGWSVADEDGLRRAWSDLILERRGLNPERVSV